MPQVARCNRGTAEGLGILFVPSITMHRFGPAPSSRPSIASSDVFIAGAQPFLLKVLGTENLVAKGNRHTNMKSQRCRQHRRLSHGGNHRILADFSYSSYRDVRVLYGFGVGLFPVIVPDVLARFL